MNVLHRMKFKITAASLGFWLVTCLSSAGCGKDGPEMATVRGTVKYKGAPVTTGTVSFVPTDQNRTGANGTIGADGTYSLQTRDPNDGAEVGEYQIAISGQDPDALNTPAPGEPVKKQANSIPAKYGNPQTSGLTKKVTSGTNTIDFDLQD